MKISKLILYFKTMKKGERRELVNAINQKKRASPSAELYPKMTKLINYLEKHHADEAKLSKENLFKVIYGKEVYSESKFKAFSNKLCKLFEDQIIMNELSSEKTSFDRDRIIMSQLKRRLIESENENSRENPLFDAYYGLVENRYGKLVENPPRDIFDYLQMHTASNHFYYNTGIDKWVDTSKTYKSKSGKKLPHPFVMLTDSLDRFYCLAKLRYACEVYARRSMLYDTFENRLEDEVRKASEKWKGDEFPLFECYRRLYDLMTDQSFDIQNFEEAKDYILGNYENISRSEFYVIISTLINAMTIKGYQGRDFQKLKHEVHDFGFKNQALSDDYFINPQLMVGYNYLTLEVGKGDEIFQFIDQNIDKVRDVSKSAESESTRERVRRICIAYGYLAASGQENYKKGLDLLYKRPITKGHFFIPYRAVRLKLLYKYNQINNEYVNKSGNSVSVTTECKNFKNALEGRRAIHSSEFYIRNLNFIRFVEELDKWVGVDNNKLLKKLNSGEYSEISYKGWLEKAVK